MEKVNGIAENKKKNVQFPEMNTLSKTAKRKMVWKFVKLFWYRIWKRKWYFPAVSEITVDQLHDQISFDQSPMIIDVRDKLEFDASEGSIAKYGHILNATCIPIMELSANLEDLSSFKDMKIVTICPGGGMSLIAAELLVKAGFKNATSLTGGMNLWHKRGYPTVTTEVLISPLEDQKPKVPEEKVSAIEGIQPPTEKFRGEVHKTLDARNLTCPLPILKSRKKMKSMKNNQVLEILTTDPASWTDIPAWVKVSGQELISAEEKGPRNYRFLVKRLESPLMD